MAVRFSGDNIEPFEDGCVGSKGALTVGLEIFFDGEDAALGSGLTLGLSGEYAGFRGLVGS